LGGGAVAAAALAAVLVDRRPDTTDLVTRCQFGAWSKRGTDVVQDHLDLEARLGVRLPVFSWFQRGGWDGDTAGRIAALAPEDPDDCLVAWEAWDLPFADVLSGARDDFFHAWCAGAAGYPGRVIVRLFHEPNGNWYPWAVASGSGAVTSPEQWRHAWQRVVGIARGTEANVEFLFCPNSADVGGIPAEEYWPGAEWVDLIGVDGYNWGWHADGSPYTTAEQVIGPMYDRLTALHRTAEFMVGEIGCAAHENKSSWYEGLFTSPKFPRLTQVAFFDEAKEQDWRLDSDGATLDVVRRQLARAPRSLA